MKTSACETHDVRLDITVWAELWQNQYDRIEIHRSTLGEAGPYYELTAANYAVASVPGDAAEGSAVGKQVPVVDKTLKVLVGTALFSYTFTGSNPITYADAALQVHEQGVLLDAYVDGAGKFILRSGAFGAQAHIEVLNSDAAALLGLPLTAPENIGYGKDPRIVLIDGVEQYTYRDYYGRKDYFYKVRFRNSMTNAVSAFSGPIDAMPGHGLPSSQLITGYVKLVRSNGQPDVKQEITIFSSTKGQQIEGATVNGGQLVFLTDNTGRIEARLIRGMQVDVGIGSMSLMRRVTVPTDPSIESFDLLDPQYGEDDTFAVQRLDTPYAEKMNL